MRKIPIAGDTAYRPGRGDGSAHRGRSVIYDCLVGSSNDYVQLVFFLLSISASISLSTCLCTGHMAMLASVSRQHLLHTLQARQANFLGYLIQSENWTYAVYQPLRGNTQWGRLCIKYILYICKLIGYMDTAELLELAQERDIWWKLVVEWSDLQPPG